MYITVELVLKSYMPKELEPGMLFITKLHQDTVKEYIEVWKLEKVPVDVSFDDFIVKHGAPVEPYLIYEEDVIINPENIGLWDEGEHVDEFVEIDVKELNMIIERFDSFVNLLVTETDDPEEVISPYVNGKVVLSAPYIFEWDEEDDDDYYPDAEI
jgi:hypothetical protein